MYIRQIPEVVFEITQYFHTVREFNHLIKCNSVVTLLSWMFGQSSEIKQR